VLRNAEAAVYNSFHTTVGAQGNTLF